MIDAHHHAWSPGRHGCAWPPPALAPIHREVSVGELERLAAPLGVVGSVLVQSQADARDTAFLLARAAAHPFVLGVVGWVELAAADAPARVAALARAPKLKGVRPMLQDLAPGWILRDELAPGLDAVERCGLVLDALVRPAHLADVAALAARRPGLAIVLDHAGKPPAGGDLGPWRAGLRAAAARPNVVCKLSGLLTELAPGAGPDAAAPVVGEVLGAFGAGRVLWGSDWPVLQLAGAGYADWLALAQACVAREAPGCAALVFGEVARRTYRLPPAAAR